MNLRSTVGLLLLLLVAIPVVSPAGESESEFDSLLYAYTATWNKHDGDALAAFFTNNADLIIGNLPRIDGREAIGDWWNSYFSRIDTARHGEFELLSLRDIAPGVKLANVGSRTFGEDTKGGELETRLARGTWVLVRRADTWRIAAMRGMPAEGEGRIRPGTDR
ncbi:MAG TPA: nuclear transport factor 2 family protein [Xanthomonadales bacterium]|nr:nuclear transport factor 2 family protein [Xanthomonadales bacterium]